MEAEGGSDRRQRDVRGEGCKREGSASCPTVESVRTTPGSRAASPPLTHVPPSARIATDRTLDNSATRPACASALCSRSCPLPPEMLLDPPQLDHPDPSTLRTAECTLMKGLTFDLCAHVPKHHSQRPAAQVGEGRAGSIPSRYASCPSTWSPCAGSARCRRRWRGGRGAPVRCERERERRGRCQLGECPCPKLACLPRPARSLNPAHKCIPDPLLNARCHPAPSADASRKVRKAKARTLVPSSDWRMTTTLRPA